MSLGVMTLILSYQKLSGVAESMNIGYIKRFLKPEFPNKIKEYTLTTFASRQANSFVHTLFYVANLIYNIQVYFSLADNTLLPL